MARTGIMQQLSARGGRRGHRLAREALSTMSTTMDLSGVVWVSRGVKARVLVG